MISNADVLAQAYSQVSEDCSAPTGEKVTSRAMAGKLGLHETSQLLLRVPADGPRGRGQEHL